MAYEVRKDGDDYIVVNTETNDIEARRSSEEAAKGAMRRCIREDERDAHNRKVAEWIDKQSTPEPEPEPDDPAKPKPPPKKPEPNNPEPAKRSSRYWGDALDD